MKAIIEKFVGDKNVALIGISLNKTKFGNMILNELTKKGYNVFPVHPTITELYGIKCYPDIKSLPDTVANLILVVNPAVSAHIVRELKDTPIQRVWFHKGVGNGAGSDVAYGICRDYGIGVVYGFCPMMFYVSEGVHRFHFWLRKNFGKVPAEFTF